MTEILSLTQLLNFFMLSNAGRMNIAVVNTSDPDWVVRIAYRDFNKLGLIKFVK